MKQILEQLKNWSACSGGLKYAVKAENVEKWWSDCERGDWMLWVVGKLAGKPGCDARKKMVLCSCKCARLALPFVAKDDDRPLKSIETAERWARGDEGVTLACVRKAAYAAYAAADAAADAAYAAADAAAYAAYAAADAAADAAYAAYAAADAAAYAAYAIRKETFKKCADIVRGFYTWQEIRYAIYAVNNELKGSDV